MPKKDEIEIKEWIKDLALREHYLPFAHPIDLWRLPKNKRCKTAGCVVENAAKILSEDSEEAEKYRQIIYHLALHGVMWGEYAYILSRVITKAYRVSEVDALSNELRSTLSYITEGEFRKRGYKDIVTMFAELVQLNFAYSSLKPVLDELTFSRSHGQARKILMPTLQSTALISRFPPQSSKETMLPEEAAKQLVSFCMGLRIETIRLFLELRPRRASDVFVPLYYWARRELENRSGLPNTLKEELQKHLWRYIYLEAILAPYFLHLYGLLELDLYRYFLSLLTFKL